MTFDLEWRWIGVALAAVLLALLPSEREHPRIHLPSLTSPRSRESVPSNARAS